MDKQHQAKVIRQLYECDHSILSVEQANKFAKPFRVPPPIEEFINDPSDPKGAHSKAVAPNRSFVGVAAEKLAMVFADKLGVEYPLVHGRGTQLRVACAAILEKIGR